MFCPLILSLVIFPGTRWIYMQCVKPPQTTLQQTKLYFVIFRIKAQLTHGSYIPVLTIGWN